MDRLRVSRLLGSLFVMTHTSAALAQVVSSGHPLPESTAAAAATKRWFELETPFTHPLRLSFDARPTPGFEILTLPTFEGRATLWQSGRLNLSLFERATPAIGLECGLTCAPTLEQSIGLEARVDVTRISRQIPATFFFVQPAMVRFGTGFLTRTSLGFGGLLDL
ncbi:MAG TPA: hypothetical protein VKP30_04330 [Polyangiaceae bacterium]|nr:hypothetical protein [Polyangiaceae bacterium]